MHTHTHTPSLVPCPLLEGGLGMRLTSTFADTFRVLLSVGLPPSYVHTQYGNTKEEGLEDFITHHVQ